MAGYNRTRYVEDLLERTEALPPSFTIHLHPEHWTLNKGPKFLYNNPIASLLDDIREHRIPVDFLELFDSARVAFYDGCMVVELLDYRPQKNKEPSLEKPERTRTVLHPNSETVWADICSLNKKLGGKWTDKDALEIEARILLATSPPICLDPDPHLTRVANHVLRVSTPTAPLSLKRKAVALEPEEDETDKARRAKIMQFMNPRPDRITPSYRILDALQRQKQGQAPTPPSTQPPVHQQPPPQLSASNSTQEQSPIDLDDANKSKPKLKKKPDTPQQPYATTAFTRANGSQTPAPPQTTHHFVNQHPQNPTVHASPSPSTHSPMQPQVYANLQAATEAAGKRTPTPQYAHSPRPPSQPQPISQPSPHPQTPVQQPPSLPAFQPPAAQFLHAPPPGTRPGAIKNSPIAPHLVPQQVTSTPQNSAHNQLMYAQHLQQQQVQQQNLLQQRLISKNGRSTPQGPPAQSTTSPARSSPLVSNQRLASRSPMPPSSQQIPPQMPQHPINYSPQYNPLLRPMHGNSPSHPQALPPHMANGSSVQNSPSPHTPSTGDNQPQPQPQSQPHPPHAYSQMYNSYQQINFAMQPGRLPPGYWPIGHGRGIVNGQPMPGMVPNGQQLPLGMGKAVPGGMPGR